MFIQILAYLSDIFSFMNNLKYFHAREDVDILKCCEILNAFKEKLNLWRKPVERGN